MLNQLEAQCLKGLTLLDLHERLDGLRSGL